MIISIIYFINSTTFFTVLQIVLFLIIYLHWFWGFIICLWLRTPWLLSTCCITRIIVWAVWFFLTLFLYYSNTEISNTVIYLIVIFGTHVYMKKIMFIHYCLEFLNRPYSTLGTIDEGQSDLLPKRMTSIDRSQ